MSPLTRTASTVIPLRQLGQTMVPAVGTRGVLTTIVAVRPGGRGKAQPRLTRPRDPDAESIRIVVRTAQRASAWQVRNLVLRELMWALIPGFRRGVPRPSAVEPLFPGAPPNEPFGLDRYFLIEFPIPRGEAGGLRWDLAYSLRNLPSIEYASVESFYGGYQPLSSQTECIDPPGDMAWSLRAIRADQVGGLVSPTGGLQNGAGIRVALLDTGYLQHGELDGILVGAGRDVTATAVDYGGKNREPTDPVTPLDPFHGHGTGVGSVLASRGAILPAGSGRNAPRDGTADAGPSTGVIGAATEASLLPIRCIDSVAVVSSSEVARGIWAGAQSGAEVLSMSLGGLPAEYIHDALRSAVYVSQMIAAAAAGQYWPWTVFPAAYDEALACAGTTYEDTPWADSSHGPAVDIAAPAQCVWRAAFDDAGAEVVEPGVGTSFSTPNVSGVAALWLAHYGRANLLARYGPTGHSLHFAFDELVRRTARTPSGWDTSVWGPGIIDASAALSAPLGDPAALGPPVHPKPSDFELLLRTFGIDGGKILAKLLGPLQTIAATVEAVAEELAELLLEEVPEAFAEGIQDVVDGATNAVDTAADAVGDAISAAGDKVSNTLGSIF